jgi:hypothetical protein
MSKDEKKNILRLMELCYDLGQENVRTGKKHRLTDLYNLWVKK